MSCDCGCSVTLSRDAMDWSAIVAFPGYAHLHFHIVFIHNKFKSEVRMDACSGRDKQTTMWDKG